MWMASSLALAGCGEAGGEASVSAEPYAVESQSLELGTTTERRIIVYRTELQQLYTVDKKGNPLLVAERSGPPVVSPDGRKVAYSKLPDSWNEGDPVVSAELYVLDKSGRSHALTRGYDDTEPVWTPNGESLLFQSTRRTGIPSLWKAQISGSHLAQVTNESTVSDSPAYIPNPASSTTVQWGPTERRIIVYSTARTTNGDVRIIDFDPTLAVKKSYSLGKGYAPRWTDDGTIVFAQDTDGQVSYVEASLQ
jgi:TolB protein